MQSAHLAEERQKGDEWESSLRQFQQAKEAQIVSVKEQCDRKVADMEGEIKKLKSDQRQQRVVAAGSPK